MTKPVKYKDALHIEPRERDSKLQLHSDAWPGPVSGWDRSDQGYLYRTITDPDHEYVKVDIWEAVLRFPSAPIHALHRLHRHQFNLRSSENFHSLRVLAPEGPPTRPPKRVFLFQNGLNENDKHGLYYQLASEIFRTDPEAICILRPFPGHLTRFPFQSYSDVPLDLYLSDGSILFRQFLRYLVESQWLISLLVTRSQYLTPAGCQLVRPNAGTAESRLTVDALADAVHTAWTAQHDFSVQEFSKRSQGQPDAPAPREPAEKESFRRAFEALRGVICWEDYEKQVAGKPNDVEYPSLSVIGYSLGGFLAQSIFMAWPFAITACSTLLAGGPLRQLAPTTFAHPEEWQTVLHSLRYELDNGMCDGLYRSNPSPSGLSKEVAGIDERLFLSLQRVFYEVFSQEYRGSYQTRLSEHGDRMLFVVGGDDPIVRPRNVIDGGPDEGVNMIEVARLRHFIGTPTQDPREAEQRKFWIPQIARLISEFANHAEHLHLNELERGWTGDIALLDWDQQLEPVEPQNPFALRFPGHPPSRLTITEELAIPPDGALNAAMFTRCVDDLLFRASGPDGFLFVLRNNIPGFLLPDEKVLLNGQALHHQDSAIRTYLERMRARRTCLDEVVSRVSLVMPAKIETMFVHQDPEHGYPTQSETPLGALPVNRRPDFHWSSVKIGMEHLMGKSPHSIRSFVAGDIRGKDMIRSAPSPGESLDKAIKIAGSEVRAGRRGELYVTALPDCWLWMDEQLVPDGTFLQAATALYGLVEKSTQIRSGSGTELQRELLAGSLRIISVSRSRLNPRFRGRLVVEPRRVAGLIIHSALCLAMSRPGINNGDERGAA